MPTKDDPRLTPPDGPATPMQVTAGVCALRGAPDPGAEMVSQALHGETVQLYREAGEFGEVQLERDGYVGWALMEALSSPVLETTHRVSALRTYVYSEPDLKSAPHFLLTLGAKVVAEEQDGQWVGCARAGWIHETHLAGLDTLEHDPAAVAVRYLGTPYLWGGRESLGLDCTGLTVAAFGACGVLLPRDSDIQFAWAGAPIEGWDAPGALQRGDLVFWKGHVGIMLDAERVIHANAHHMAVAAEPLDGAISRIAVHYGDPIGARRIDVAESRGQAPDWLPR
ncbi:MAG: NlpC/P60 family protein [Pseudomonadota bacterium]